MPDYATILIALGSAGLAGYGGAYLQARHERKESLWDRRIDAADDFATKLAQTAIGAQEALRAPTPDALVELRRLLDEALAASARLDLLFGVRSPTVELANRALGAYDDVFKHLTADPSDQAEAESSVHVGAQALALFAAEAGSVIRRRRE